MRFLVAQVEAECRMVVISADSHGNNLTFGLLLKKGFITFSRNALVPVVVFEICESTRIDREINLIIDQVEGSVHTGVCAWNAKGEICEAGDSVARSTRPCRLVNTVSGSDPFSFFIALVLNLLVLSSAFALFSTSSRMSFLPWAPALSSSTPFWVEGAEIVLTRIPEIASQLNFLQELLIAWRKYSMRLKCDIA